MGGQCIVIYKVCKGIYRNISEGTNQKFSTTITQSQLVLCSVIYKDNISFEIFNKIFPLYIYGISVHKRRGLIRSFWMLNRIDRI